MGELKKRVVAGVLLAPLTAFLFYILPIEWFFVFLAIMAAFAVFESVNMAKITAKYLPLLIVVLSFIPLYYKLYDAYLLWLLTSPLIYLLITVADSRARKKNMNLEIMGAITVILLSEVFIVLPFFCVFLLKELNNYLPLILLFSLWSGDTFAYFTGKKFGRIPLVPQISPKKTVEGFAGAVAGSLIVIVLTVNLSGLTVTKAIIAGILIGIFGQFGDIFESLCKRVSGVKDSSALIPGHGGILDRMDSFIFTAPFFYYFCNMTGI